MSHTLEFWHWVLACGPGPLYHIDDWCFSHSAKRYIWRERREKNCHRPSSQTFCWWPNSLQRRQRQLLWQEWLLPSPGRGHGHGHHLGFDKGLGGIRVSTPFTVNGAHCQWGRGANKDNNLMMEDLSSSQSRFLDHRVWYGWVWYDYSELVKRFSVCAQPWSHTAIAFAFFFRFCFLTFAMSSKEQERDEQDLIVLSSCLPS